MKKWEQFEIDCTNYLKEQFENIKVTLKGGSDSTTSDILIETTDEKQFYIEAKMPAAQCGQFVLTPNFTEKNFKYSSKTEENEYSKAIRKYMNNNFNDFCNATGHGTAIELEAEIFYNWIKTFYTSKNVKFVISRRAHYTIIPLEMFEQFFTVRAKYRIKRSGTANPSRNNKSEIIKMLDKLKEETGCTYQLEYGNSKSKTYVEIAYNLKDPYIQADNYEYIFRKEGNRYYLRRRSNTLNANVIFSINLRRKKLPENEYLISYLNTISTKGE